MNSFWQAYDDEQISTLLRKIQDIKASTKSNLPAGTRRVSLCIHCNLLHGQESLHKSVIFVSDEERHNAVLVYTFIKELISHIRNTFEKDITCITGRTPRRHNIATRPSSTSSASINNYFRLQLLGLSLRQVIVKDCVADLEEHQKGWRMMP